jgi:hypothetical protein
LTSDIKAIVSTPIWTSERPEHLIGIVSIDSTVGHGEGGLLSQESLDEALQLAAVMAQILELAELV